MISFQVNDMRCGHCVRNITHAVNGLDAHARLQFDLAQHQVHIEATVANAPQLAEAIRAAGYTPAAVSPSPASATPGMAPVRKGCCC